MHLYGKKSLLLRLLTKIKNINLISIEPVFYCFILFSILDQPLFFRFSKVSILFATMLSLFFLFLLQKSFNTFGKLFFVAFLFFFLEYLADELFRMNYIREKTLNQRSFRVTSTETTSSCIEQGHEKNFIVNNTVLFQGQCICILLQTLVDDINSFLDVLYIIT